MSLINIEVFGLVLPAEEHEGELKAQIPDSVVWNWKESGSWKQLSDDPFLYKGRPVTLYRHERRRGYSCNRRYHSGAEIKRSIREDLNYDKFREFERAFRDFEAESPFVVPVFKDDGSIEGDLPEVTRVEYAKDALTGEPLECFAALGYRDLPEEEFVVRVFLVRSEAERNIVKTQKRFDDVPQIVRWRAAQVRREAELSAQLPALVARKEGLERRLKALSGVPSMLLEGISFPGRYDFTLDAGHDPASLRQQLDSAEEAIALLERASSD